MDVTRELRLDWDSVKTLDTPYMRAQLARAGTPGPKAIGIDEISIRRRHTYRIVVSDLIHRRPIWFGGVDRTEASRQTFDDWLGPKKSADIRLAVTDGWKQFRNATTVAPREPDLGKTTGIEDGCSPQPAIAHRLPAHGVFRSARELPE